MRASPIIVTRPSAAGQRLVDSLTERGHRVLWWPAFDIGPAPDVAAAREALSRLASYHLALFVSVNAVRAAGPFLSGDWPRDTAIGAVGPVTRAAVEAELRLDARTTVIAPDIDDESGSEAFWRVWQARGQTATRVLILRAEDGREWLAQRFIATGAHVDAIAVYSRQPHCLSRVDLTQMQDCIDAGVVPTIIFSSSETIATLDAQVTASAQEWLRSGTAICTHPRIGEQLRDAGYARVIDAAVDDDSIIAKLESVALKR
ncbi:MAG TPA: uroporphyrinogen-III synthase [Burkholderiaceae bacterium]|nr:uroporphyrinogen-III synthase [Burkholderiaceae bacterium]